MSPERSNESVDGDATSPRIENTQELDLSARQYGIYQCTSCDNIALSLHGCEGMSCHGERMEPITDWEIDVNPPELRQVLLDVFGLPKSGLDICLCVIGDGPLPPGEVADRLGYDESTVRTYLNTLVDLGLLQKSQLNREGGGFVNVYHSIDIEKMRRETLVGFYVWAGEAASLIEEANLTKEDYLSEGSDEPLNEIFWEAFEES